MQFTDDRYHLRVELASQDCEIPADERTRLQRLLEPLGEAVKDFPHSELWLKAIHHPGNGNYHLEAKLKLPGQTLFSGDWDPYLDSALQRCLHKLTLKVEAYRENPDRRAIEVAEQRETLDREVVIPEGADTGPLGRAVHAGDYRSFRNTLVLYEDWLRRRVGRWIQRFPRAEARVGDGLLIGDLVEEVYLNAFERYDARPEEVPFHEWLDSLIDPSLKALLRHPDEEHQNASMARTLRDTPLPR